MNVWTRLTGKTLKANRTRTAVTIVGIVLAAAMLTAVTTFISSLRQYLIANIIAEEGNWHGEAIQIPADKVEELESLSQVEAQVTWQDLGYAASHLKGTDDTDARPYYHVVGVDEAFTEMVPVTVEEGRLPKHAGEILLPSSLKSTMETLGEKAWEIGDTITLELGDRFLEGERLSEINPPVYRYEERGELAETWEKRETRTYTVVGYGEEADYSSAAFLCFTGKDTDPAPDSLYNSFFRLRKGRDVYEFASRYLGDYGVIYNSQLLRMQGISTNQAYLQFLYGMSAILILLIMTGGISLVYNSFAISVSDRTKQFGLLASIGATPRQLRGMVFREALLLSGIGIPLGILAGIGGIGVTLRVTSGSFRYLYSGKIAMGLHVSWPAIVLAAAVALITVLISAWLPAGRAAKLSPMEAIRLSRDIRLPGREQEGWRRKGRSGKRLFGFPALLAGRHFARERRKYRTTVLSLSISIVLFVSASSFSYYIKKSALGVNDIPAYDLSVYGVRDSELQQRIEKLDGVESALCVRECYPEILAKPEQLPEEFRALCPEAETDGEGYLHLQSRVLVLSDTDYETWLLAEGIPVPETKEGMVPLVVINEITSYNGGTGRYEKAEVLKEGEPISLTFTDYKALNEAKKASDTYVEQEADKIMGKGYLAVSVEQSPMNCMAGQTSPGIIVSESQLWSLLGDRAGDCLPRNCIYLKSGKHQEVAEAAEKLLEQSSANPGEYYYVNDVTREVQSRRNVLLTVDIFAYGFIILISLIAAANVFNTISTAFLLRRREFAVLSSVGMTPGEMNRMLSYECLLYGVRALLYGLPVSVLVTWAIYRVAVGSLDTSFVIPVSSIVIVIISVFLVVFSSMLYARSRMGKENLIDRIRQESL